MQKRTLLALRESMWNSKLSLFSQIPFFIFHFIHWFFFTRLLFFHGCYCFHIFHFVIDFIVSWFSLFLLISLFSTCSLCSLFQSLPNKETLVFIFIFYLFQNRAETRLVGFTVFVVSLFQTRPKNEILFVHCFHSFPFQNRADTRPLFSRVRCFQCSFSESTRKTTSTAFTVFIASLLLASTWWASVKTIENSTHTKRLEIVPTLEIVPEKEDRSDWTNQANQAIDELFGCQKLKAMTRAPVFVRPHAHEDNLWRID